MQKSFVRGERPQKRAYSPAVITHGVGKIIWIAGHTGNVDDNGKSLAAISTPSAGRPSATSNGGWGKLAPSSPTW